MSVSEERAYKAMIDIFYGGVFGIIPKYILEDARKVFEDGEDFDLYCVKQEGWNNLNEVYELASMIKSMSKKEQKQFMVKCPSKILKQFVKENL